MLLLLLLAGSVLCQNEDLKAFPMEKSSTSSHKVIRGTTECLFTYMSGQATPTPTPTPTPSKAQELSSDPPIDKDEMWKSIVGSCKVFTTPDQRWNYEVRYI